MLNWKQISPGKEAPKSINAIIECPKGTRNKYELSKNTNMLTLDRVLHSSNVYPQNYGLIPGTFAKDGDPLDILVIMADPVHPLTLIKTKPLGVLMMEDEEGMDEKILSVAVDDPFFKIYTDVDDIPNHYMAEIKEFFRTYKNLEEPKYAEVKEWKDKSHAYEIIEDAINRFNEKYSPSNVIYPK